MIVLAKKEFHAFNPQFSLARLLDEQTRQHYEIREAELNKLQDIAESIVRNTEAYRASKEQEYNEKTRKLEEENETKQKELAQKYDNKFRELENIKTELDKRQAGFDDRESKHVRRKIRDEFKQELQKRAVKFELTEGTQRLRLPIFVFTLTLLIFFGAGSAIYFYESLKLLAEGKVLDTTQILALLAKQLIITGSFGATAIFFLRWNNQWFQKHANEEFRLKRLDLDIDRASWVVEMALEWKAEKGTEISEELLDRLTRNLFVDNEQTPEDLHPADQIASALFGASAAVKLKLGETGELTLDRKGINKLAKGKEKE